MPQASDKLRAKIAAYFPDDGSEYYSAIDTRGPITYLESLGWTIDDKFYIAPGPGRTHPMVTEQEWDCIDFLIQEWDFGFYGFDP